MWNERVPPILQIRILFHSLEAVDRVIEAQFQVGENVK